MDSAQLLGLVLGALALTALSRRLGWPAPLVVLAAGLGASFLPGMPEFHLDSHLILGVVLPPLLYSAALRSSYQGLRSSLQPVLSLGVGLVVATAAAVGLVTYLLVPGIPLAVALVVGAVVAPPDAVAAVAIGQRLGLPRRVVTVLTGESLINDAAALTLYQVAIAAAVGTGATLVSGLEVFTVATVVGLAVGLVLGAAVHAVRVHLDDPRLEVAFGLVLPFVAYFLAEELHGSGVLAVVAAGLYVGHRSPRAGYATRLQEQPVWDAVDTLLEALVFGLIGLQLRGVVDGVASSGYGWSAVAAVSVAVLATAIAVRPVWVFGLAWLRRLPWPWRRGARPLPPSPPQLAVVSWSSMRGVVTLAAAAGVPLVVDDGGPFPDRSVIQLLAFVVTLGTLVLQGLTLPWLIRRVHATDPAEAGRDAATEARLYQVTTAAAVARLDELARAHPDLLTPDLRERIAAALGAWGRAMVRAAGERGEGADGGDTFRRVRTELLATQRRVLVAERDAGRLDDEVMRRVLHELDLEEAALSSSWLVRD